MFVPYDHVDRVPEAAQPALAILQAVSRDVFSGGVVVGSGGKSVGYLAHGTATDYMFETLKVPVAYTWEIFGDMKADYNDCFRCVRVRVRAAAAHARPRNARARAVFLVVTRSGGGRKGAAARRCPKQRRGRC